MISCTAINFWVSCSARSSQFFFKGFLFTSPESKLYSEIWSCYFKS